MADAKCAYVTPTGVFHMQTQRALRRPVTVPRRYDLGNFRGNREIGLVSRQPCGHFVSRLCYFNTTARLCLPVSPQNQRLLKQATVISGKPLISEKAKSLTARLMTYMFDGVLKDSALYSNANSFADLCEQNQTVVSDNSLTHSLVDHRR